MRRILVDHARARAAKKRGGNAQQVPLNEELAAADRAADELLALDEALTELERHAQAAQLVKLRHFSGVSHQQAAQMRGITRRVGDRVWVVAKAWLFKRLGER